jgi:phage tail-like protein
VARIDPLRSFRYRLEIDNISHVGFSEVTIAETTIDAIEYREGTDPPYVRKLSGLTKYVNVTLKWGLTIGGTALELFKWHADVSTGQKGQA